MRKNVTTMQSDNSKKKNDVLSEHSLQLNFEFKTKVIIVIDLIKINKIKTKIMPIVQLKRNFLDLHFGLEFKQKKKKMKRLSVLWEKCLCLRIEFYD